MSTIKPSPLVPVLVGVERKGASIIDEPLAAFSTPPYLLPTAKHSTIYNVGRHLSSLGTDLESKSVPIPPFVIVDVLWIQPEKTLGLEVLQSLRMEYLPMPFPLQPWHLLPVTTIITHPVDHKLSWRGNKTPILEHAKKSDICLALMPIYYYFPL